MICKTERAFRIIGCIVVGLQLVGYIYSVLYPYIWVHMIYGFDWETSSLATKKVIWGDRRDLWTYEATIDLVTPISMAALSYLSIPPFHDEAQYRKISRIVLTGFWVLIPILILSLFQGMNTFLE